MFFEPVLEQIVPRPKVEAPAQPVLPPQPGVGRPAPSADDVRMADHAFSEMRECDLVAGLLGMQFGILMLHDVLVDTLTVADEEDEVKPRLKPDPQDGEEP
jgi:hypothetical protein